MVLLHFVETWFHQISLEHLGWDFICSVGVSRWGKTYLGQCLGISWWFACRQRGELLSTGFVSTNGSIARTLVWRGVRRGCGTRWDQRSNIGSTKRYKSLLRKRIRTLYWRYISGWNSICTKVHTSYTSYLNFWSSCMSGWRDLPIARQISKEAN